MSEDKNNFDPVAWEKALEACKTDISPSEQDWASWKCDGGPHKASQPTEATPYANYTIRHIGATSMRTTPFVDITG